MQCAFEWAFQMTSGFTHDLLSDLLEMCCTLPASTCLNYEKKKSDSGSVSYETNKVIVGHVKT